MKNYLILFAGIVGAGSSVFFIKGSLLAPLSLSAARLLIAALLLTPFMLHALHRRGRKLHRGDLKIAIPGAIALVAHYATWFFGVRETTASLSTLIVNLSPVMMPFLVYFMMGQRITRGEIVGSVVATLGVVLLAFSKDETGVNTTLGIVVCLVSMFLCVLYLAFGRRLGRGTNLFLYIVPLYWVAGVISLLLAIALREPLPELTTQQVLLAIGAAVVPTVIGHTALNHAMMHLPSQVVSIANLGQFLVVVAAILIWPSLGERPTWHLVPPASLVLGGAFIVIRFAPPAVAKRIETAATEPPGT